MILDSLDLVRVMDRRIAEILEGTSSEHHRRFVAACATHNLSLNAAKQLLGSFRGTVQGGEILGRASRPERPRGRTDHPDRAGPPDPCSTTRPRAWTGFPPSYYSRSPFETSLAT